MHAQISSGKALSKNIWERVKDAGWSTERICYRDTGKASTDPSKSSKAEKTLWTWFQVRKVGGCPEFVSLLPLVLRCRPTQETGEFDLRQGSSV